MVRTSPRLASLQEALAHRAFGFQMEGGNSLGQERQRRGARGFASAGMRNEQDQNREAP